MTSPWLGAGPAGLATAVYAASERPVVSRHRRSGLRGQASRHARIENYFGFGHRDHRPGTRRARFHPAQKFGAISPCPPLQPGHCHPREAKGPPLSLVLEDGADRLHARRRHRLGCALPSSFDPGAGRFRAAGFLLGLSHRGSELPGKGRGPRRRGNSADRERFSSPVTLPACCCSSGVRPCPRACRATL